MSSPHFPRLADKQKQSFLIRPIEAKDDGILSAIIHIVIPEFGAVGSGFAIQDAEVDAMCEAYAIHKAAYFVVERKTQVQGGGGIAPLAGAETDICELRKMYFLKSLRGLGAGQALLTHCLETARSLNYRYCYLETLTHMDKARKLYERNGFEQIPNSLGNTGHFGCNTFYLLRL